MRSVAALLGICLVSMAFMPGSTAEEPEPPGPTDPERSILLSPTNGTFLLGLFGYQVDPGFPAQGEDPDTHLSTRSWDLNTTGCHLRIFADLDYKPTSTTNDPDAPLDVPYVFSIHTTFNNTTMAQRLFEPREHILVGDLPEAGNLTIRLSLHQGIAVNWNLTIYATEALQCGGPIELDALAGHGTPTRHRHPISL